MAKIKKHEQDKIIDNSWKQEKMEAVKQIICINSLNFKYKNHNSKSVTNKIPIFFALNSDKNMHALSVTIISILNNTNSFCEFYILESNVSDNCKAKCELLRERYDNFSLEWIKVKPQEIFKDLPIHSNSTNGKVSHNWVNYYDIYSRFLIPTIKPSINKAIYLDYDIMALGDIKELYEQDLDKYSIGAVWEFFYNNEYSNKRLGIAKEHKTFSSGVLLLNCERLRNEDFLNKIIKLNNDINYKEIMMLGGDQELLNIYFANNYKLLDYKFNVFSPHQNATNYNFKEDDFAKFVEGNINDKIRIKYLGDFNINNVIIRHFNGQKPWDIKNFYNSFKWEEWWCYAKESPFSKEILLNFLERND